MTNSISKIKFGSTTIKRAHLMRLLYWCGEAVVKPSEIARDATFRIEIKAKGTTFEFDNYNDLDFFLTFKNFSDSYKFTELKMMVKGSGAFDHKKIEIEFSQKLANTITVTYSDAAWVANTAAGLNKLLYEWRNYNNHYNIGVFVGIAAGWLASFLTTINLGFVVGMASIMTLASFLTVFQMFWVGLFLFHLAGKLKFIPNQNTLKLFS